MKMRGAWIAVVLALVAAPSVAKDSVTAPWTSPVCGAGPVGDRPAGVDADGDGVVDSDDWCPRTKSGDRVGSNGCAVWEIPVNCPKPIMASPAPVRVMPVAAAPAAEPRNRDADGDGVEDEDDKCPGTPRGAEVDIRGCVLIEKVVLKGVNFDTGSAKLLPAASNILNSVASAMKAAPQLEVEVGGHTDSVGKEDYNQDLSERRAKSVKEFLVNAGIDASRLKTKGYGEATPVDTNDTAEGRANNRRVAFKVTDD